MSLKRLARHVALSLRKAVLRTAGMRPPFISLLRTALFGMVFTAIGLGAFFTFADIKAVRIADQAADLVAKRLVNDTRIHESQLGALKNKNNLIIPKDAKPSEIIVFDDETMRDLGSMDLALSEEHSLERVKPQELFLETDISAFRFKALGPSPSKKSRSR